MEEDYTDKSTGQYVKYEQSSRVDFKGTRKFRKSEIAEHRITGKEGYEAKPGEYLILEPYSIDPSKPLPTWAEFFEEQFEAQKNTQTAYTENGEGDSKFSHLVEQDMKLDQADEDGRTRSRIPRAPKGWVPPIAGAVKAESS